jgi:cytidylate kinase
MPPSVIAIDGPAGSGKTVIGRRLADALGYVYLDTGALYRAVTWLAIDRGVSPRDGERLAALARDAAIRIERPTVADGRADITRELSTPAVAEAVSIVAAHPQVRAELLPLQRRVASQGKTVMAGRDIGTVVCPTAELKLYLEAPLTVRIARRIEQLDTQGRNPDANRVAAELAERDRIDQSRAMAPLVPAADAVVIDTSAFTIDEELAFILELLARRDR